MHRYLKSIGFSNLESKEELRGLLSRIQENADITDELEVDKEKICKYAKYFNKNTGIIVQGSINEQEQFQNEFYYPFYKGTEISSYADIIIERKKDNESYMGICEDVRIGVSLIFFLQNSLDYLRAIERGTIGKQGSSLTLIGLSKSGKILLPIEKDQEQIKHSKEESRNRMMLISAARRGDAEAIETLTLEDIDTYSKVSKMLISQDVFSIVDTYFMPYGVECDEYSIMGEILSIKTIKNSITNEEMYCMKLDVNEMVIEVCVPVEETLGEPAIGRRFKGVVWLQGHINFVE